MRYCALIGTWKVVKEYKAQSVAHALGQIVDYCPAYNRQAVVLVYAHSWIMLQPKKYWRLLTHSIPRSRRLHKLRKQQRSRQIEV